MSSQQLIDEFRRVRLLASASEELLSELARISHIRDVAAQTTVFRHGEPARTVFLLREGQVLIEICAAGVGCRQVATIGPGELLGWSPVLASGSYTTTARTGTPSSLIELDGSELNRVFAQRPELGYEFMKHLALAMAKRLNATRLQLLNVYGTDSESVAEPMPGSATQKAATS